MRRAAAIMLLAVIVASLALPAQYTCSMQCSSPVADVVVDGPALSTSLLGSVSFPAPLDTTLTVPEYPLVSRALMLGGGSTDAIMEDFNGDGATDLVVAVAGANELSLFFRQTDDTFLSWPSLNVTLDSEPIDIEPIDRYGDGDLQIVVLQRKATALDYDHFVLVNITSETAYTKTSPITLSTGANSVVVADLRGDNRPDLALLSVGPNPESESGIVELFTGPLYDSSLQLYAGHGSCSLVSADFDGNGTADIAVANQYDSTVEVFLSPFVPPVVSPNWTLSISGEPLSIVSGNFNAGSDIDLAVACQSPNSIQFFYQSTNQLPTTFSVNLPLSSPCSRLVADDLNNDGRTDLLALSDEMCVARGHYQGESTPLWSSDPDFSLPTGACPLGAVVGDLTGDGVPDLAVASARPDSSGSSIAVYPSGPSGFSNSNSTTWTYSTYAASLISVGDLNGDEVQDLVLGYPATNSFGYMLGFSGDTNFVGLGYVPDDLIVTDLNGDGYSDVLTSNASHPYALYFLGGPSLPGSLLMSRFNCSGNITDIDTGDFDSDGLMDVIASTANGTIEMLMNAGSSPLYSDALVLDITPGASVRSIAVGDFNSDGLDDLAYPRAPNFLDIMFQNVVSAPFSLPADLELSASVLSPFVRLWSGDITGDFEDDLVAMMDSDERLYLFNHDQFSTGVPYGYLALPEAPTFVSVTDVTDDGHADVVATFPSADLLFLYRQSGVSLPSSPSMTFVTGAYPTCAVLADGTGDHRGDLLVLDSGSHSISVWEQLNYPPVADAGGPYVTGQGDWHQFDGSTTTAYSELPYMEYMWDFGDGGTADWSLDQAPEHQYLSLGNFTVTMWVRDPAGLMDDDTTWIEVVDSAPHTDFTWSPLNPTEGESVVFQDTTYSYDEVVLLNWTVDSVLVSTGLEQSITRVFDEGSHSIRLTATDSDGSVVSITKYVFVQALDPELEISAPSVVDEGDEVQFVVIVDERFGGPVDPIVSYEWDFSYDGAFEVDEITLVNTTTRVFGASGYSEIYTVAVRVTDSDGDANTTMVSVEVMDIGPSASASLSVTVAEEGVPFSFIDATYTYDGIVSWSWTLTYPDSSTQAWSYDAEAMAELVFEVGDGDYSMRLEVDESDGDTDVFVLDFVVQEIAPVVVLTVTPSAPSYDEFQTLTLNAQAESFDDIVSYEWDFISLGAQFAADMETDTGEASYSYSWVGNYTAKVRVSDSGGSAEIQAVDIEIVDAGLAGSFDSDLVVTRDDPDRTSIITFDASSLADRYPDISTTLWEFGDGENELLLSAPADPVTHTYTPTRDYVMNVTMVDDDGNDLVLSTTLHMVEPAIDLIGPANGSVVISGTAIRFTVGDDSPPLVHVRYSVDGGEYEDFETLYSISTEGWADGTYIIDVMAEDKDGNIAYERDVTVTIDDTSPTVTLLFDSEHAYGGDKMNVTIQVGDANIGSGDVVLFVTFPGDDSSTSFLMHPSDDGVFYALVEVPKRTGEMQFYVEVSDLAGNSVTSDTYSVTVELRFMDAAWPYLLALAVAAALGTGIYFMREVSIAVDETFVIYNDGRLLAHSTRRLKPGMDDQILSGMFVAVQDFIRDSFKDETSFKLRKLDFGDKSVLVEKGEHLFLAVVLHGKVSKKVARRMKSVLDDIEDAYSEHLVDWDGDLDSVRGVNDRVKRLYSKAPVMPVAAKRKET